MADGISYKIGIDNSDVKAGLNETEQMFVSSASKFQDAFQRGFNLDGTLNDIKNKIKTASASLADLRAEYEDFRAHGQGTPTYEEDLDRYKEDIQEATEYLKGLKEQFRQRNGDEGKFFAGLAEGGRGVFGAFTAAQGALSMFGASSENLQKVQTKLQASMSILMGLQQAQNALQSTSTFRTQTLVKLQEMWHRVNLKVVQSEGLKKAALIAGAGAIAGLVAGLIMLMKYLSKTNEEQKYFNELQKQWTSETANSAAKSLTAYYKLQKQWEDTNGSLQEQTKFIRDNKDEMDALGLSVSNVEQAERTFVSNSQAVVDGFMARAKAAAYYSQAENIAAKLVENELKKEQEQNGWQKAGTLLFTDQKYVIPELKKMLKGDQTFTEAMKAARNASLEVEDDALEEKYGEFIDKYFEELKKAGAVFGPSSNSGGRSRSPFSKFFDSSQAEIRAVESENAVLQHNIEQKKKLYQDSTEEEQKLLDNQKKIIDIRTKAKIEALNREEEETRKGIENMTDAESKAISDYYDAMRKEAQDEANGEKNNLDQGFLWGKTDRSQELLNEYRSLVDQQAEIDAKYQKDKADLEAQMTEENAERTKRALEELEKWYGDATDTIRRQTDDAYQNLWRNPASMSKDSILRAIKTARDEINKEQTKNGGPDPEKIAALLGQLEALEEELYSLGTKNLQTDLLGIENLYKKKKLLQDQLKTLDKQNKKYGETAEAIERINGDIQNSWVATGVSIFADTLSMAANSMKELAAASGNVKLDEVANVLQGTSSVINGALAGFAATGNWIGAAIGGGTALLEQLVGLWTETKKQEIEAKKALGEYANEMRKLREESDKARYSNAFGTDIFKTFLLDKQTVANYKEVLASNINTVLKDVSKTIASKGTKYSGLKLPPLTLDDDFGEELKVWYESALAMYPKLLDQDQKNAIEKMISYWDSYKAAVEDIHEYLADVFGDVASQVSDKMLDNFIKTGSVISDMTEYMDNFSKAVAKSIIESQLMSKVFTNEAQEEIAQLLALGGPDNVAEAITQYNELLAAANEQAPAIEEFLRGIGGVAGWSADSDAYTKGFGQMNQETAESLDGRFTTMQFMLNEVNESVKGIREQNGLLVSTTTDILDEVRGIHFDTSDISTEVASMRKDLGAMKRQVDKIADSGVIMQ